MAGIDDYNPVDDGAGTTDDWYTENNPLGAAIAQRFANNSVWLGQNRLNKSSKTWDCTVSSDSSPSTFSTSAGDATKILGYTGEVGGSSTSDTETIGFQFSSHPGAPVAIPIGWKLSPGAGRIKVRIAMEVLGAPGAMYIHPFGAVASPGLPVTNPNTFMPLVAGEFFNPLIRGSQGYQELALSSTNGTDGSSYYELITEWGRFEAGSEDVVRQFNDDISIVIFFQSGVDLTSPETLQIGSSSPSAVEAALTTGNRVIRTNSNMSKYSGVRNPGKYHRVAKFDYNAGTPWEQTWHHVEQLRPYDFTIGAFHSSNPETFVLWPSIPSTGVPPSLTGGGGGMNAGALEGTGLLNGDSFSLYPITQFNIYSITVEEVYE